MATKRALSLTKQLKAATTEAAEQKAHAEKLQGELKNANAAKDMYYKQSNERAEEINQVHTLIDALPNSIGRESEPGTYGSRTQYALMTRLAAWLATRP